MNRCHPVLLLCLLAVVAAGCSDQNAPTSAAHPDGWILVHAADAEQDLHGCEVCHGADFRGGTAAASCFACHLGGPPFRIHPADWADSDAHQSFPETLSWTTCAVAACHGEDLHGGHGSGPTGPDCFSASFDGTNCHAGGPPAPHAPSFADPDAHGAEAKIDQLTCRNCHGRPNTIFDGGFVSAPAILDDENGNCSTAACHPAARAHPTNWQGSNDPDPAVYRATHRNVPADAVGKSCALCHTTTHAGAGPLPGAPSCFSASFTNADGSATGCHAEGPGQVPHDLPFTAPTDHGTLAQDDLAFCQNCHGTPGTTEFAGGIAETSCAACHPDAGAHPTSWQGTNDPDDAYLASHMDVDSAGVQSGCGICHNTAGTDPGPEPAAPSCLSRSFTNAGAATTGCHAQGPGTANHPVPYADPVDHGPSAKQSGLNSCQVCHGEPGTTAFDGGLAFTACSQAGCHPSAGAHPTNWQGSNDPDLTYASTHRDVSLDTTAAQCGICHLVDAVGAGANPAAPSCLSTNFTNSDGNTTGCHPGGPGTAPHALPFIFPADHGPVAKQELSFCQNCHGTPGTVDFDGGTVGGIPCSTCHPAAGAHPTTWQGTNDPDPTYAASHRSAGDVTVSCGICHNTTQAGPGSHPDAPSCLSAGFTNSNGSTTGCHPDGPGAPHDIPFTAPASHGPAAKQDLSACQQCHGNPPTTAFDGGTADTACSLCHPAAGAHPTHWQGTNDTTASYLSSHRTSANQGVACVICHDVTAGHTAPNPAAPSCFSDNFTNAGGILSGCHPTGPGAPHAVPFVPLAAGDSVSIVAHGNEAKGDLTFCQHCHAAPFDGGPGSNPRFNVLLGRLSDPGSGKTGCEVCHDTNTAHPVPWVQGRVVDHNEFGNQAVACALCHGANLEGAAEGGVGPACTTCHLAGLPVALAGGQAALESCTSCHNVPPDGAAPAGDVRPNREGAHTAIVHGALPQVQGVCQTCHDGAGTGSSVHYDTEAPATVSMLTVYNAVSGVAARNPDGTCANVSCHGGQTSPPWFTGTLDVNTECTACHELGPEAGSPEANSYFSGGHATHAEAGGYADRAEFPVTCVACHDTAALAPDHYVGLATTAFEGDPAGTILAAFGYDPNAAEPTCTTGVAGCHPSDTRGWNAPHALDGSYLAPAAHGPDAEADLTACQPCHGAPGGAGDNPRFNVGIESIAGTGCEGCHNDGTAHPSQGARESVPWYDRVFSHRDAGQLTTACALCHGANLGGGVGPACTTCHETSPVANPSGCASCHSTPPNGNAYPNRQGEHGVGDHRLACSTCHSTGGYDTVNHFDLSAPADATPPAGESITFTPGTPVTCNGTCHGQNHSNETW